MPPPRPPSRIDPLSFPVFGMSWYADPADGTSIIAFCGGGGAAKTGVGNSIIILDGDLPTRQIRTGDEVGEALQIYSNPTTGKLWMVVALHHKIQRYALPSGEKAGDVHVGDNCAAIAINSMADRMAVGLGEAGVVKIFSISDEPFAEEIPLYTLKGHQKMICSLAFSLRGGRLISSAKDGTACIWNEDGAIIRGLRCSVTDPDEAKRPKKPMRGNERVLVRGCAFGDMDGHVAYTVASGRRGNAYLTKWVQTGEVVDTGEAEISCELRTACSPSPVSAMALSHDGSLLAFGTVDGSIILWSVEKWKKIKTFKEVHDFPITTIVARPFQVPLRGEQDGVRIDARSASADSKLACLTRQRRAPRNKNNASQDWKGLGVLDWMYRALWLAFLWWVFTPVFEEARSKCAATWHEHKSISGAMQCIVDEVLIAPGSKPGVSTPPY